VRQLRSPVQGDVGYVQFFSIGVDREALRKEIFFLAYHLHWPHDQIMELSTEERKAYVRLLIEQIERENAALESSSRR
jgi:hypothetical protein